MPQNPRRDKSQFGVHESAITLANIWVIACSSGNSPQDMFAAEEINSFLIKPLTVYL